MSMKIYVSPYYRTAMWGSVVSAIMIDLIVLYYSFYSVESIIRNLTVDLGWFIFEITFFWVVILCLFTMIWRFLIHTKVEDYFYQSYLGRRKQCYVDRTKDIYYTVFGYPAKKVDSYGKDSYIAFSNEPFVAKYYLTNWGSFINKYDTKKIILLPYYEEIVPYLNVENWHKIEMEYPESMKKMEKWFK